MTYILYLAIGFILGAIAGISFFLLGCGDLFKRGRLFYKTSAGKWLPNNPIFSGKGNLK